MLLVCSVTIWLVVLVKTKNDSSSTTGKPARIVYGRLLVYASE